MKNALSKWIISASGWRTVFAKSADEQDSTTEITNENAALVYLAAKAFSTYISEKKTKCPDCSGDRYKTYRKNNCLNLFPCLKKFWRKCVLFRNYCRS